MKVLVIDVGGTNVKVSAAGKEQRRFPSGRSLTPEVAISQVRKLTRGWRYEAVSIGLPGRVSGGTPAEEPGNLGRGWVDFNYEAALKRPVRLINDAALQALGCYSGGRMLFLGLGTGLGSTLIAKRVIVPLELGDLRYNAQKTIFDVVGKKGRNELGREKWNKAVLEVIGLLRAAIAPDYIVLGGGHAKEVGPLPDYVQRGHNRNAFDGGERLWETNDEEGDEPPTKWLMV